ncbi:MAG: exodeoxyribonuclease III [Caldithrix sp.]|nr:exodeoxyribonuclease III [Caldithrix sp.]
MRIVSWNVNGIRAAIRHGFLTWLAGNNIDILCLQEVKARREQAASHLKNVNGYQIEWNAAQKPGYSGVANLNRIAPLKSWFGFGIHEFDDEGRIIIQEFESFILLNIYFPNGKRDMNRLDYKLRFYDAYLDYVNQLRKSNKAIITCGDFNTAHKPIDLKNPKANEKYSGFLPVERAWMDKFLAQGYVDTFRLFNKDGGNYSWWTYRNNARQRNIGWRIDYFFIDAEHQHMITDAHILSDVKGSDHCPVAIDLQA